MRPCDAALASALLFGGCGGDGPPPPPPAAQAAPPPQAQVSGEANVLGFHITLVDADPCLVRFGRSGEPPAELRLGLPPPCTLHRNADGTVRVHPVKDRQVVLVQRSTPDPAHAGDCDTRIQALIVSADGVRNSTAVERVAMCAPFRWDDVMFIGLAESTLKP